jgi:class 3 adenylate cyclase
MSNRSVIEQELATSIDKARKQVTILFTDIVDSSRYWDQFGDIKGRMMVDQHNRLVFPVIEKFHGRVVKTIGDGLMAEFRRPNDALNAAIGIQQILNKMRDADRSFHAKVRIGLHTGVAIVEKNDVYGDAVNVAKRVESFGDANEIYLSASTADLVSEKKHAFHKKGSFIPKGKREPMTVYRCRWNEYRDLTRGLKLNTDFPLGSREKGDIVAYSVIAILCFTVIFLVYLRYILAASDSLVADLPGKIVFLNPWLIFQEYSFLSSLACALFLAMILILIWMRTIPYMVLRIMKGIAGFGLGFALIYVPVSYFDIGFGTDHSQEIAKTAQRFVRVPYVIAEEILGTGLPSKNIYTFFEWDLMLPVAGDSALEHKIRHLLNKNNIEPVEPAVAGVWRKANLSMHKPGAFHFRLLDLCAICLGVMGFLSGFLNFSIVPR